MLAFNAAEFLAVSALCPGQSRTHRHAQWGLNATNGFATADETAYPMGLARFLAIIFTKVLLNLHIKPLPDTLEQIQSCSLQALQKMRATVGQQGRASRMPPLVRTYKQRLKLQGPRAALPQFSVLQRTKEPLVLIQQPLQSLPKGSRLLSVEHVSSLLKGGLDRDETLDNVNDTLDNVNDGRNAIHANANLNANSDLGRNSDVFGNKMYVDENSSLCRNPDNFGMEKNFSGDFLQILTLKCPDVGQQDDLQVQTWGTPWGPEEFVEMTVRAGHPSTMQSFLPPLLTHCIDRVTQTAVHARVKHRANALKHWMRRSLELREDEKKFVAGLHPSVTEVLKGKRLLLWKEML